MEIRVDGGGGAEGEEVKRIALEWSCGFGDKVDRVLILSIDPTACYIECGGVRH